MRRALRACLAAVVASLAGTWAVAAAPAPAAADTPLAWLARMDQALRTLNYEGVFVHECGGTSETLRVIHRSRGGDSDERLVSMDGSGREFIRRGAKLLAYLPDEHAVLVEKSSVLNLALGGLPSLDAGLTANYQVHELARQRLLGREARTFAIVPNDSYRYGYRLWIDENTAMLLKTQMRTAADVLIEQIVFTSLTLGEPISDASLAPAVDARGFRWLRHPEEGPAADMAAAWQAVGLPPGFRLTAHNTRQMPNAPGPVAHLVFSDGLATVSVFVELMPAAGAEALTPDVTRLGSSSAYSTLAEGHRVTAIGEVPPETVRAIAHSLREGVVPGGAEPPLPAEAALPGVGRPGAAPGLGFMGGIPLVPPSAQSPVGFGPPHR